jgi:hypothetical protein
MMERWKDGIRSLTASTFGLTAGERRIILLILGLALLGLGAKAWHRAHPPANDPVGEEEAAAVR